jgi:hypothetical protein
MIYKSLRTIFLVVSAAMLWSFDLGPTPVVFHSSDFASSAPAVLLTECSDLFLPRSENRSAKRTWAQRKSQGYETQYAFRRSYVKRASAVVNGRYDELFHTQFPELEGDLGNTTILTGYRTRQVSKKINVPGSDIDSPLFSEIAERAVNFGIGTYEERRKRWSPEFLQKLRTTAKLYLRESIYIIDQEGVGYDPRGKIRGTIRLIKEKNGFVPMETYLGISVDVGDKLKVEPGNFAVDKDYKEEAWPEVIMHLLGQGAKQIEEGRENHYLTYADRYSLLLYSQLGFKPIDLDKIKVLNKNAVIKNGKIFKDGIWWTPMEASQETLDQLMAVHIERLKRRGHSPDEISALAERQVELEKNPMHGLESRYVWGVGRINGKDGVAELEISRGYKRQLALSLKIGRGNETFQIAEFPISLLPFKNGYTHFGDLEYLYMNGMLTLTRKTNVGSATIRIVTTPDLKLVQSVDVEEVREGQRTQLQATF